MANYKTKIVFPSGESFETEAIPSGLHITRNFTIYEAANKQAQDSVKLIITQRFLKFATMLQELRDWYRKPMTVNSWYRAPLFNRKCGGASNSLHLDGLAMDWGVDHTEIQHEHIQKKWQAICEKHGEIGGINHYTHGYHLSIGEEKFGNTAFKVREYRGKSGDW